MSDNRYYSKSELAAMYGLGVRPFMRELYGYAKINKLLVAHGKHKKTLPPYIVTAIKTHLDGETERT